MFEILLILLQALFVAFWASGATAIVLGTWPTPQGAFGVFLLYCVVGAFLKVALSISPDMTRLGHSEFVQVFIAFFLVLTLWCQSEFLRPQGYARMSLNQAATIFFLVGIGLYAFDYVATAKDKSQSESSIEHPK